jgi:rhodanese-related sulfurtransferase
MIRRAIILIALGAALGVAANIFLPGRIPWLRPTLAAADRITLDQAKTAWQSGDAILLDARDAKDYTAGHIAGALNLSIENFDTAFPAVRPRLAPEQSLVLYCDGAHCDQSLRLLLRLRPLGYTNAHVLVNGWTEWKRAKLPTTTGVEP